MNTALILSANTSTFCPAPASMSRAPNAYRSTIAIFSRKLNCFPRAPPAGRGVVPCTAPLPILSRLRPRPRPRSPPRPSPGEPMTGVRVFGERGVTGRRACGVRWARDGCTGARRGRGHEERGGRCGAFAGSKAGGRGAGARQARGGRRVALAGARTTGGQREARSGRWSTRRGSAGFARVAGGLVGDTGG